MPNTKLVIFTDCYPYGSSEPFLKNEMECLARNFSEIKLVPLSYGTSRELRAVPGNVTVTLPILTNSKSKAELLAKGLLNLSPAGAYLAELIGSRAYQTSKMAWSWGIGFLLSRAVMANPEVKAILADKTCSLLYFYWGIRSSFIIPLIKEHQKKIAVRFHGSDTYEETNGGYLPLRAEQLKGMTKAYFCSEYGKTYIERKYPFVRYKSELSRLGVHDHGLCRQSTDGTLRIITIANMVPIKRMELLAEALTLSDKSIEWTHFGDGETLQAVRAITAVFPPNIRAKLMGRQPNERMLDHLLANPFDLFVNVSSSEGVPVSIMEALSMGIPVLATAVGGTPEIVDDKVGLLVPANITPQALSDAIAMMSERLSDESIRINARNRWKERCDANSLYQNFSESLLNL